MYEFAFLLILGFANIGLCFYNKIPILNFVVAAFTLAMGALTIGAPDYPFQPYFSLFVIVLAVMCMVSGALEYRS